MLAAIRFALGVALIAGCTALAAGCTAPVTTPSPVGASDQQAAVLAIVERAMSEYDLRAAIVRVDRGGEAIVTVASGESLPGVPVTADMHFRNGAVAISYLATALLVLVDEGKVSLDDPLAMWLPDVAHSGEVTLGELARMTSGYADYMWDAEFLAALDTDPLRQWTPEELYTIGTEQPLVYEPGTNWNYSHTSYVLLGLALEKITGMPLNELLSEKVLEPLGLEQTTDPGTPAVQEPALHVYTSERREHLGIPAGIPFYEESTYWNPSWTIARGAIQNTDIADLARGARGVATGELLSAESHRAQLDTGSRQIASLVDGCPACFPHSEVYTYGIGVVMMGDWVLQNPVFSGTSAIGAHLLGKDLTIAVVTTFREAAFENSASPSSATDVFRDIVAEIAPEDLPPTREDIGQ
ncbi:MAG TPA: serine hydrolase domain-containing protein [Microbacterium sp.]|nr:serine hydrolase domain-containing protein [Microbacterium sp.]